MYWENVLKLLCMFFYLKLAGHPSPILKDLGWKNIVKLWSDPLISLFFKLLSSL